MSLRRIPGAVLLLACAGWLSAVTPLLAQPEPSGGTAAAPSERIDSLLASGALVEQPNPVLLELLLEEEPAYLPEPTRKAALEQITGALREQTLVSPFSFMEEMGGPMGLVRSQMKGAAKDKLRPGNLLRSALGAPPSAEQQRRRRAETQRTLRTALVDPWARGLAAAGAMARAGFESDASEFYRRCLASPTLVASGGSSERASGTEISAWSRWVLTRCEQGLVALGVEVAGPIFSELAAEGQPELGIDFSRLAAMAKAYGAEDVEEPEVEPLPGIQAAGLSGLATLLETGELGAAQRRELIGTAFSVLEGPKRELDDSVAAAAATTLGLAAEPRAREALERLAGHQKRFPLGSWAAREALAVGYRDAKSVRQLERRLRRGGSEEVWKAFEPLLELDHPSAWEWAEDQLGRGSVPMDQVDWRSTLIDRFAHAADPKSLELLRGADRSDARAKSYHQALLAVALFQRGERDRLPELAAAVEREDWDLGRRTIGQWWHRVRPILKAAALVAAGLPLGQDAAQQLVTDFAFGALDAHRAQERREAGAVRSLRYKVAVALGGWDDPRTLPLIERLLQVDQDSTRLAAARALLGQTSAAALPTLSRALELDYGEERGASRSPEIQAALLLHANARFGSDPRVAELIDSAAGLESPSVRFLAATLSLDKP